MNSSQRKDQSPGQNKGISGKDRSHEKNSTVWGVIATGIILWVVAIALLFSQDANSDTVKEKDSDVHSCIQEAIREIKRVAPPDDLDNWYYAVSVANGKCSYLIGRKEDYTRELLENQQPNSHIF